ARPWPEGSPVVASSLRLAEGGRVLADGVSLRLARGRRVGVVGASGSGKSTLLRAVAGLDDPAAGDVRVGDEPVSTIDEASLRRHLAFVVGEPGLLRGRALDVILLGRGARRDPLADLARLGISADPSTTFDALSRGERQRVAVVRSLVGSPDVVVLDDPTSGLGSAETDAVLDLLESTASAVLIATHDPRVAAWCDEVIDLDRAAR
ncbi:MAG: ABC transporter ATP-binding protein, partial [Acidimicrobiales bacterium]